VKLDSVFAPGLGPRELTGMPFDERLGVSRDLEVLVEAGRRLADLRVSELDQ
jgi:hypothetical protein